MKDKTRRTGTLRSTWGEFWAGMTDLSALSLWVMLAVFLPVAGLTIWLFSPGVMAGAMGAFVPRSSRDADAFALVEALRMRQDHGRHPTILFLGSSTVAQMVAEGDWLASALPGDTAGDWRLRILTTPLQSPLDQLRLLETALADRPADAAPVIVVIGMGLTRLGWTDTRMLESDKASRIPLQSAWADAELASRGAVVPQPWSVWVLDHRDFVALNGPKSLIRLALGHPAHRDVDTYARGSGPGERQQAALRSSIAAGIAEREDFYALYEHIARRLQSLPGVTVVFLEETLSPDFLQAGGIEAEADRFRNEIGALAARVGAEFWPVVTEAELTSGDYFDALHIREGKAQAACQDRILTHLAPLVRQIGGGT